MTADERIITAVQTSDGAYVDGTKFNELLDKTKGGTVEVKEVYGDKAYFRAPILGKLKDENIAPYIPVSASAYRIDEALFSYNKDSDQWFCALGNETVSRRTCHTKRGGTDRSYFVYTCAAEFCVNCPHRAACMGKATGKARRLEVSLNTAELYAVSQWQKSDDFQEKYKKRAAQEWKNAEMKRFHGLARARGFGLCSVATQAKLTAIAVNLKRIAALAAEKGGRKHAAFAILSPWLSNFSRPTLFSHLQSAQVAQPA